MGEDRKQVRMPGKAPNQGPQLSQADIEALTKANAEAAAPAGSSSTAPANAGGQPAEAEAAGPAAVDAAAGQTGAAEAQAEQPGAGRAVPAPAVGGAEVAAKEVPAPPQIQGQPLDLPSLATGRDKRTSNDIGLLNDVELDVKIELGRAQMLIEDVLRLGQGSVVELDKLAGDPVDVLVNDRLVARGEVLVLNDSFCVRINEVLPGIGAEEAA
jgi:flagellar motor switch protein FliN